MAAERALMGLPRMDGKPSSVPRGGTPEVKPRPVGKRERRARMAGPQAEITTSAAIAAPIPLRMRTETRRTAPVALRPTGTESVRTVAAPPPPGVRRRQWEVSSHTPTAQQRPEPTPIPYERPPLRLVQPQTKEKPQPTSWTDSLRPSVLFEKARDKVADYRRRRTMHVVPEQPERIGFHPNIASETPTERHARTPEAAAGKGWKMPEWSQVTDFAKRHITTGGRKLRRLVSSTPVPFETNYVPPTAEFIHVIGDQTKQLALQSEQEASRNIRDWMRSKAKDQRGGKAHVGHKIGHFFKKALTQTFEQGDRVKLREIIAAKKHEHHNILASVYNPYIRKHNYVEGSGVHKVQEHVADQHAKTQELELQIRKGINVGRQVLDDTVIRLDHDSPFFKALVSKVIEPIAKGDNSRADRVTVENDLLAVIAEHSNHPDVQRIFGNAGWAEKFKMIATDVHDKAVRQQKYQDKYNLDPSDPEHRKVADHIEIYIADLQSGSQTGVSNTAIDRSVNWLQRKITPAITPATYATGLAAVMLAATRLPGAVMRATQTASTIASTEFSSIFTNIYEHPLPNYILYPSLIAGGIAALRRRRQINADMELSSRRHAQGEQLAANATRRDKRLDRFYLRHSMHEGISADTLINGNFNGKGSKTSLNRLIAHFKANPEGHNSYTLLIDRLGEINARQNFAAKRDKKHGGVDTIGSGLVKTQNQGSFELTQAIDMALDALHITPIPSATGSATPFESARIQNDILKNTKAWEKQLEREWKKKRDSYRMNAFGKSMLTGLATTGVALGFATAGRIVTGAFGWMFGERNRSLEAVRKVNTGETVTVGDYSVQKGQGASVMLSDGVVTVPGVIDGDNIITHADIPAVAQEKLAESGISMRNALPDTPVVLSRHLTSFGTQLDLPPGTQIRQDGDRLSLWTNEPTPRELAHSVVINKETGEVTINGVSPLIELENTPGDRRSIDSRRIIHRYTAAPEGGIQWNANAYLEDADNNERRLDNRKTGPHEVEWHVNRMTSDGSWVYGDPDNWIDMPATVEEHANYYSFWDDQVDPDAPGGYRNPITVRANLSNGGLRLNQDAPDTRFVQILRGDQLVRVRESEIANLAFVRNLDGYERASEYTGHDNKFRLKVSASTLTRNAAGELVLEYVATHDADAPQIAEIPTQRTRITGAKILHFTGGDNVDVGIPAAITKRDAVGATDETMTRASTALPVPPVVPVVTLPPTGPGPGPIAPPALVVHAPVQWTAENNTTYRPRQTSESTNRMYRDTAALDMTPQETTDLYANVYGFLHLRNYENYRNYSNTWIAPTRNAATNRLNQHFRDREFQVDTLLNLFAGYQSAMGEEDPQTFWERFLQFAAAYFAVEAKEKEKKEQKQQTQAV